MGGVLLWRNGTFICVWKQLKHLPGGAGLLDCVGFVKEVYSHCWHPTDEALGDAIADPNKGTDGFSVGEPQAESHANQACLPSRVSK